MGQGREQRGSDSPCSAAAALDHNEDAVPAIGSPPQLPVDLAAAALAAAAASAAAGTLPPALFLPVPHLQQCYNWDCGLACALMVLRALGLQQYHMGSLLQMCRTRSIWTIDLAHLLAACSTRVQMLTVTIGANQEYAGEVFYAEHMREDSARVEGLFAAAEAAGICVQQRSLPLSQLKSLLLSGTCLLLALVDKATLCSASLESSSGSSSSGSSSGGSSGSSSSGSRSLGASGTGTGGGCRVSQPTAAAALQASEAADRGGQPEESARCSDNMQAAAAACSSGGSSGGGSGSGSGATGTGSATAGAGSGSASGGGGGGGGGYLGHYIVLCGYDSCSDRFEIRDPASDRQRLWLPAAQLEAARKHFGTDEDLLVVAVAAAAGEAGAVGAGAAVGASGAAAAGSWLG